MVVPQGLTISRSGSDRQPKIVPLTKYNNLCEEDSLGTLMRLMP